MNTNIITVSQQGGSIQQGGVSPKVKGIQRTNHPPHHHSWLPIKPFTHSHTHTHTHRSSSPVSMVHAVTELIPSVFLLPKLLGALRPTFDHRKIDSSPGLVGSHTLDLQGRPVKASQSAFSLSHSPALCSGWKKVVRCVWVCVGWVGEEGLADHKSTPPHCDGAYVMASAYHGRSVGFPSQRSALKTLSLSICV